jgi:hypothetical protein
VCGACFVCVLDMDGSGGGGDKDVGLSPATHKPLTRPPTQTTHKTQYAIILVIDNSVPRVARMLVQVVPIFVGFTLLGVGFCVTDGTERSHTLVSVCVCVCVFWGMDGWMGGVTT